MHERGLTSTSNITGFLGNIGISSGLLGFKSSKRLILVSGVWLVELTPEGSVLVALKLSELEISGVFKLSVSVVPAIALSIRRVRSGRISTDIESAGEVILPKFGVRMRFSTDGENPADD